MGDIRSSFKLKKGEQQRRRRQQRGGVRNARWFRVLPVETLGKLQSVQAAAVALGQDPLLGSDSVSPQLLVSAVVRTELSVMTSLRRTPRPRAPPWPGPPHTHTTPPWPGPPPPTTPPWHSKMLLHALFQRLLVRTPNPPPPKYPPNKYPPQPSDHHSLLGI